MVKTEQRQGTAYGYARTSVRELLVQRVQWRHEPAHLTAGPAWICAGAVKTPGEERNSPTNHNHFRARGNTLHAVQDDRSFPRLATEKSTEQLTILIVEDEPLIRMALEEFLESRGHICAHATTVESALELTQRLAFDAALLDVSLRDEQVYPVVLALQKQGVRCIFMTGHLKEDLPAEFAHLRYIEKPFDEAAVIAALAGCGGPELRAVG